jgi:hypothetical protein
VLNEIQPLVEGDDDRDRRCCRLLAVEIDRVDFRFADNPLLQAGQGVASMSCRQLAADVPAASELGEDLRSHLLRVDDGVRATDLDRDSLRGLQLGYPSTREQARRRQLD